MAYMNLYDHLTMNFVMQQNDFIIGHIERMVPWERSAYFDIMQNDLNKRASQQGQT